MKNLFKISLLVISLFSCEDVVDVDLLNQEERLVIEAHIDWEKGSLGNEQTIKLSQTTPYFQEEKAPAIGAEVKIINAEGQVFKFQDQGNGNYYTHEFEPKLNTTYTLDVRYKNQVYNGSETMMPAIEIQNIEKEVVSSFDGEKPVVKVKIQDIPKVKNNYLLYYTSSINNQRKFYVLEDKYFDGNEFFFVLEGDIEKDEVKQGDTEDFEIKLLNISYRTFDFMLKIFEQTSQNDSPFQTPPASVKGNMTNISDNQNYPLGYFRLNQSLTENYTLHYE